MLTIKTFATGGVLLLALISGSEQAYAACRNDIVRTTPDRVFTISTDGLTVTDSRTGLVWDRCLLGQSGASCSGTAAGYNLQQALIEATTRNAPPAYKGFSDWRLPNIKELATLVDDACTSPAFNEVVFPNHPAEGFAWSSSPDASDASRAWFVFFGNGYFVSNFRSSTGSVRLVRGGQ